MKLSIIIPVYNVEQYLAECLESVKQLSIDNELIVVNDGSTDNSLVIIEEFASKYSGDIKIINKENGGLSSARNAGMLAACGDYISFLDSDDYIDVEKFEALIQKAYIDQVDMACGDCCYLINNSLHKSETYDHRNKILKSSPEVLTGIEYAEKYFDYKNNIINTEACFIIYRSSFLKGNNLLFKEGIYHEDTLFNMTCFLYAKKVKFYNYDFYIYRMSENSIMRTSDLRRIQKKLIDKQTIALELFELKKANSVSKTFLDSVILDLLLYSAMERKVKVRNIDEVLKLCYKRTIKTRLRVLIFKIMSIFYEVA